MHLASINSAKEQKDLQEYIQAYGKYILDNLNESFGAYSKYRR